jgi:hypothetical protein
VRAFHQPVDTAAAVEQTVIGVNVKVDEIFVCGSLASSKQLRDKSVAISNAHRGKKFPAAIAGHGTAANVKTLLAFGLPHGDCLFWPP